MYIDRVKDDIVHGLKKSLVMNITKKEEMAFQDLLKDDSIVIRPADKGSGITVLNRTDYIDELEKEMEESTMYEESDQDLTSKVHRKVKKLAEQLYKKDYISGDLKSYLVPKLPKPGKLKGNPKIHKAGNPYRTIVSGIGIATKNMAEIAEKELESFCGIII